MTEIKDVLGELYPEIADFLAKQAYFNQLAMQEEYDQLTEELARRALEPTAASS